MTIHRLLCALLFAISLSVALQLGILYRLFSSSTVPMTNSAVNPKPPVEQPIRQLLPTPTMSLDGIVSEGNAQARLAIVEFSDFECPYCSRHATTVLEELRKQFVVPGRLRYAFANNPLSIHSTAEFLAHTALCANAQGQFSNMYEALFRKRPRTEAETRILVKELNLESKKFEECMRDPLVKQQIEKQKQIASSLGFTSTPTFGLGIISATDGKVSIHKAIVGSQPLAVFQTAIRDLEVEAGLSAQQ